MGFTRVPPAPIDDIDVTAAPPPASPYAAAIARLWAGCHRSESGAKPDPSPPLFPVTSAPPPALPRKEEPVDAALAANAVDELPLPLPARLYADVGAVTALADDDDAAGYEPPTEP